MPEEKGMNKKTEKTKIVQYFMKPVIIIILLNTSDQETLKGSQGKYTFSQNDSSQNIIEHNI